jgi:putative tricarboxylic transport membrane protein
MVLALVLGDMAEASFRQAMLLSQGSLSIFWSNPLVGTIAGLAILMLLWPAYGGLKEAIRHRQMVADGRKPG